MKIGVYGSAAGDITETVRELARKVGRQIALRGHTLITGACPGIPYEAVLGANEKGGEVIGFSPAINEQDHIERFGFSTQGFTELIYLPEDYKHRELKKVCLKYRNVSSVANSDSALIVSGRCGTLNEFTIAYDLGKNIGVLTGTGGMTKFLETLVEDWNKPSESKIIYETEPGKLIEELEKVT